MVTATRPGPVQTPEKAKENQPPSAPTAEPGPLWRSLATGVPADSLVGHMESAFGMPFAGVRLRTDDAAAERASNLGAKAYTDGREIGFAKGRFVPQTQEGLRTAVHEFAHVAQARAAGAVTNKPAFAAPALESNARSAADAVLSGYTPSIQPGGFRIACEDGRDASPKTPSGQVEATGVNKNKVKPGQAPAEEPTLPEGVPYEIRGWLAAVRVSWLKDKGWSGTAGSASVPDAITELIRKEAEAQGFNWITDEVIAEHVGKLVLTMQDPGDHDVILITMIHMLAEFGPPPDLDFVWTRAGDGMNLVFQTSSLVGTHPVQAEGGWIIQNSALNIRIADALEAKTGLTIKPEIRAQIQTSSTVTLPSLQNLQAGFILPLPRSNMEAWFGKDEWQSYLDKPASAEGKAGTPASPTPTEGSDGGTAGGTKPGGDPKALEQLRKVYDYLKQNFPDELKDCSFEDFIKYLQLQDPSSKPSDPNGEPDFTDKEKWSTFVQSWLTDKKLPPTDSGKATGELPEFYKFAPAGEMELLPEIKDRRYVVGSDLTVRMVMGPQPPDNVLINAFPNKANFIWSIKGPEAGVDEGLLPDQGLGAIEHSLKFTKPGLYVIGVNVTSKYFSGGAVLQRARSVTVINPGERLDEIFNEMLTGPSPGMFGPGPDGKIIATPLAKGLTFEQQKAALQDQIAAIEDLVKNHEFTRQDADEAISLLNDKIDKLTQFSKEAGPAGRPYVAQAVYLSEETSTSFRMQITMYGSVEKADGKIKYTVLIADTTSVTKSPRYMATVVVDTGDDESASLKKAEKSAIDAAGAALESENDYPDGHVRLVVQLHESAPDIVTKDLNTRNSSKAVKHAAGYAGMVLGAAGMVGGVFFTEGATTPIWVKVLVVSAAAAGILQAGVSIDQRVRTGQFGDSWTTEAIDILQIATSMAGLATMPMKAVPGGIQVSMKLADKAQIVFLGTSVKLEIDRANKEYALNVAQKMPKDQAARERDAAIASVLQGAAMTGGFMLISHALHAGAGGAPHEAPPPGEEVKPELRKLAYEGSTEDVKAKLQEKSLKPDERRFLSDMLDWRENHANVKPNEPPPQEGELGKPGQPGENHADQGPPLTTDEPVKPAPQKPAAHAEKPPAGSAPVEPAGQPPEVRSNEPAKPGDPGIAPSPDVDPYPSGLAHIVNTEAEARSSFQDSISVDPTREVAIYVDPKTGEHLVVQGEGTTVPTDFAGEPGMERAWTLVEHYHPGSDKGARLASVDDFKAMMHNQLTGLEPAGPVSTKIRWVDPHSKIQFVTEIGFTPGAEKPYWIKYRDTNGQWQTKFLEDTPWNAGSDYIFFLRGEGIPQPIIPEAHPGVASTPQTTPAIPEPGAPPTAPPAAAAHAPDLPKINRNQRASIQDIADALHERGFGWEALGFHDDASVAGFFRSQPDVDAAIREMVRRLRQKLRIAEVHGQAQNPQGWSSRKSTGLPEREGPDVPEGQRLPRGTEEASTDPGGFWGGERGNSEWSSDDPGVNRVTGYKEVWFRNGFPDFAPWALERVRIEVTGIDDKDFAAADKLMFGRRGFKSQTAYAEWRSAERLTWHHVEGSSEMILVPRDLHENVPHLGGASEARAKAAATAGSVTGP